MRESNGYMDFTFRLNEKLYRIHLWVEWQGGHALRICVDQQVTSFQFIGNDQDIVGAIHEYELSLIEKLN